jgi:predicted RNA methylase
MMRSEAEVTPIAFPERISLGRRSFFHALLRLHVSAGLDLKGKSVAGTGSGILALAAAAAGAKIVVAMEVSANLGADYN